MQIIGMNIEEYIGQAVTQTDGYDFIYTDAVFEKHIIFAVLIDNTKVKIILSHSEGSCGSGYTTASWGNIELLYPSEFDEFEYTPIKELIVPDITDDMIKSGSDYYEGYTFSNEVFRVTELASCPYYPSGYYKVKMELFELNKNYKG